MPEKEIAARGGAIRYRYKRVGKGKYVLIAVVPKKGPHGGHTVASAPRKIKGGKRGE